MQVAEGAAELYVAQLGQLRSLTLHGSAQLAADLEYFCNIVSALGVSTPPALATWQVRSPTHAVLNANCLYARC